MASDEAAKYIVRRFSDNLDHSISDPLEPSILREITGVNSREGLHRENLWKKAYEALPSDERTAFESLLSPGEGSRWVTEPSMKWADMTEMIDQARIGYHDRGSKLTKVSEMIERIEKKWRGSKDIFDVMIQESPTFAFFWAGAKFSLISSQVEGASKTSNALEYITKLIRRYAEMELPSILDKKTKLGDDLAEAVTSLYCQVLRYLATAVSHFDSRRPKKIKQFTQFRPAQQLDQILDSVKQNEADCDQLLQTIESINQRSRMEQLQKLNIDAANLQRKEMEQLQYILHRQDWKVDSLLELSHRQREDNEKLRELLSRRSAHIEPRESDQTFDSDVQRPPDELETLKIQKAITWFNEFKNEVQDVVKERIKDTDIPIKIAVIDSGLDYQHPLIIEHAARIIACRSFVPGSKEDEIQDSHGHGTHVTHLLLKTAPRAEVFVAKAFIDGRGGELDQNSKSIASAIRYAVETWEVDIISMSWGCKREIPEIKTEIRNAFHRGVTMFAAASNDGRVSTVTFPANLRQVICVNSCDGSLYPSHFNPPPKPDTNITIVGEFLEAAWPIHLCQNGKTTASQTGTSIATPIAAGIAALVLEYARQRGPKGSRIDKPDVLRHCDEIRKVLRFMVRDRETQYQCLLPSRLFYRKSGNSTIHPIICSMISDALAGVPG